MIHLERTGSWFWGIADEQEDCGCEYSVVPYVVHGLTKSVHTVLGGCTVRSTVQLTQINL